MSRPLDTNILIRALTGDSVELSPRAFALMVALDSGTRVARLTEAVLVETVQVLSSKTLYNTPREEIRRYLRRIILFKGIQLLNKRRYLRTLDLYVTIPRLSFGDALLAIYAQDDPDGDVTVISFDEGFDRVPGLSRDLLPTSTTSEEREE